MFVEWERWKRANIVFVLPTHKCFILFGIKTTTKTFGEDEKSEWLSAFMEKPLKDSKVKRTSTS